MGSADKICAENQNTPFIYLFFIYYDPSRCVVSIYYYTSPSINITMSRDIVVSQYIWLHVSAYLKPSSGQ
jgi:hypothetical protein